MTNTNGKVTVSRDVAEALEELNAYPYEPETIIKAHAVTDLWEGGRTEVLNGLPLDTLIRALYIGYEVERTPEEELADFIEEHHSKHDPMFRKPSDDYHYGLSRGARKAAEILGVTLPERTDVN